MFRNTVKPPVDGLLPGRSENSPKLHTVPSRVSLFLVFQVHEIVIQLMNSMNSSLKLKYFQL